MPSGTPAAPLPSRRTPPFSNGSLPTATRYRHMALTARPLASAGSAADWVFRHFGNYIRCYGVVPSRLDPALPQYDHDKADFLRWFGEADFFVDDSEENVAAVRTLGVNGDPVPAALEPGVATALKIP